MTIVFLGLAITNCLSTEIGKNIQVDDIKIDLSSSKRGYLTTTILESKPSDSLFKDRLAWQVLFKSANPGASPLIANGIVFPPSVTDFVINANTGEKLFYDDQEDREFIRNTIEDSLLVFSSRRSLSVLNLYNGQIIYKLKRDTRSNRSQTPRLISGHHHLIMTHDNTYTWTNIVTGEIIWEINSTNRFRPYSLIMNEIILVGDIENIYAINVKNGMIEWQFKIPGGLGSAPIVDDNTLFFWASKKGLGSIDLTTLDLEWLFVGNERTLKYGRLVKLLLDHDLIYLSEAGIKAISSTNGQVIWEKSEFLKNERVLQDQYIWKFDNNLVFFITYDDEAIIASLNSSGGNEWYGISLSNNLGRARYIFAEDSYKNLVVAYDSEGRIVALELTTL